MWTGDSPRMRLSVRPPAQNALFRRVRLSSPGQTSGRLTERRTLPPAPHGKMHSATYISRKGAFWPRRLTERRSLTVREIAECAFPSRCGAREVWGNPPPGCGALWRMAQLGKRARATSRQPAGRVARGPADLGSESNLTEGRALPDRRAPECAFPSRRDRRMRLSVECAFPHLGKRGAASRKSALWPDRLTERRALCAEPHQKAHSGLIDSCKGALCDPQVAQNAPFRHAAAPGGCGATPRQAAGHYGECLNWANALGQPPASLRGGLRECPQISVRSLTSRKGALCSLRLTERRTLA